VVVVLHRWYHAPAVAPMGDRISLPVSRRVCREQSEPALEHIDQGGAGAMYAVIKTGGKQYRVAQGDVIEVERLKNTEGTATFTPILVVGDDGQTTYGTKDLKPYTVTAKVLGEAKGDKVTSFKFKNKTGSASKSGHRQLHSLIEIVSIATAAAPASAPAPAPAAEPEPAPAPTPTETATESAAPAEGGAEAGPS
jgi:large subunit ribosomal protein L21